jgi:hypothetical protein
MIVDVDSRLTPCSHHPSPELLAAVANNQKEQQARRRVLAQYSNKFAGYAAFAKAYVQTVQAGRSMDEIMPTVEADLCNLNPKLNINNGHKPIPIEH